MIYVIINQSHEWGDPIDDQIDFISTSLADAERIWDEYYSSYSTMDNTKWCHSADLREYSDGYCAYTFNKSEVKVLKHIDNVGE